jgi:hypothetical protein
MPTKRIKTWILFGAACLSLPLCCLSVMTFAPGIFSGAFTVVNRSGATLYITPIFSAYGQRHVAVQSFSKFPYLPILKEAGLQLAPDESVRIICEVDEDYTFSEIAVRNASGDYRQMDIQMPTTTLSLGLSQPSFTIGPFHELPGISPAALEVARKAEQPNLRALGAIGLGFIPIGLFAIWLRLARSD